MTPDSPRTAWQNWPIWLSPVNSHSNSNNPSFLFPALYQRHALLRLGRRRSRRLMTAQGAAADNACRDGAPRGARASSQEARASRDPHPLQNLGPGSSACRPADRKAGLREPIARLPGRLPALHPSPMERGGKQGTGAPGRPKNKAPGQWSVGYDPPLSFRDRGKHGTRKSRRASDFSDSGFRVRSIARRRRA